MSSVPEIGDLVGGKYRISRVLGAGGMGIVFEAQNELTEKRVALKVLRPQFAARPEHVRRMLREAQASARIQHPNVVDIFDVGSEGDTPFLVMEYLEGETLAVRLGRGVLSTAEALALLIPAMRGVAAGHACGIVHRDLKPENILLARQVYRREPVPKVLDFGISKVPSLSGEDLSLTESGATLGTPLYMSYEQLSGARDIDGRADVYAFGVILYECLTGRTPFRAETLGSLAVQVATTTPPLPSELRADLQRELDDVVMRAIARSRDARFGSLDAFVLALSPFVGEGAPLPGVDTLPAMGSLSVEPLASTQPKLEDALQPAADLRAPRGDGTRLRVAWWATSLLALALGYVLFRSASSSATRHPVTHQNVPQQHQQAAERLDASMLPSAKSAVADPGASPAQSSPIAPDAERAPAVTSPPASKRQRKASKRLIDEAVTAPAKPVSVPATAATPASARGQGAVVDKGPIYRAGKPSLDEF